MNELELPRKYMEIFFKTKDFQALAELFDENLDFQGPFLQSDSALEYIESLTSSPPVDVSYEMVEEFSHEHTVCYIYRFTKKGKSTLMTQIFWMKGGRIHKIRLVFNPQEIA